MSLYNLSLPAGADPFDMDSYSKTPEVSRAASQEMGLSNILWVEGSSDVSAIKELLKLPKDLDVRGVRVGPFEINKEKVLEEFLRYTPVPNEPQEFFSVDRDMDGMLQEPLLPDNDRRLFYQMCEKQRTGGYNDLECFLYSSQLLKDILVTKYEIAEKDIGNIWIQIQKAASFIGALRFGSRFVRKRYADELNIAEKHVLDYRCPDEDPFNEDDFKRSYPCVCEVDARLLLENGWMTMDNLKINIDYDACFDNLPNFCLGRRSLVLEAIEKAKEVLNGMKRSGHRLDYCRGHDLTYVLTVLLNYTDGCPAPDNCRELENDIVKWSFSKDDYGTKFQKELDKIELFRRFGKTTA